MNQQQFTNKQLDQVISNILRVGIIIASLIILIGGVIYLFIYGNQELNNCIFSGEPSDLRSVSGVIKKALNLEPHAITLLGILILICTPVARVAVAVWAFAKQGDRTYVIITLIVLTILLYSLFGVRTN